MLIVIRCDAGATLGLGHLMRCRVLALELGKQGFDCLLLGPSKDYWEAGDDALFSDWIVMPFQASPAEDALRLVEIAREQGAKAAVVDDYRADLAYQEVLRDAGIAWLQFNSGPDRPILADLILNPSPVANAAAYRKVVTNPALRLLLGPDYALLRPEFACSQEPLPRATPNQVFVNFGGGDDRGAVLQTLEALLPGLPADVRFTVVSGRHNPRNPAIAEWIAARKSNRMELHVSPAAALPALMARCSLAIIAGGGTTYEANFCGLPMLLVALADNQVAHAQAWEQAGAARYLGRLETLRAGALVDAAQDVLDRQRDGAPLDNGKRLVDGRGGGRVARALGECLAA